MVFYSSASTHHLAGIQSSTMQSKKQQMLRGLSAFGPHGPYLSFSSDVFALFSFTGKCAYPIKFLLNSVRFTVSCSIKWLHSQLALISDRPTLSGLYILFLLTPKLWYFVLHLPVSLGLSLMLTLFHAEKTQLIKKRFRAKASRSTCSGLPRVTVLPKTHRSSLVFYFSSSFYSLFLFKAFIVA